MPLSHSRNNSPAKSLRVLYSSILGLEFFALGHFIAFSKGEDTPNFTTWCYPSLVIQSVSLGNLQVDTRCALCPIVAPFLLDLLCSLSVVAGLAHSLDVNGEDFHSVRDIGSFAFLTWFHQRFCLLGKSHDSGVFEHGDVASFILRWLVISLGRTILRSYIDRLGQPKQRSTTETFPPHAPPEELKPLPSHLKYAYLNDHQQLPMIIANNLHQKQEEKLLQVLRHHKKAIWWKLSDLPRISPSICMHRILLEEEA
ncbi:hypothetical protein CR513_55390, partial [Mucuna pruriens]